MIDVSRVNWTGPKINPKTKKLYHFETNELAKAVESGVGVPGQLEFGTDEVGKFFEFIAESGGTDSASTENSTYPRSETRETLANGDDKEANWAPDSAPVHGLKAKLRVMQMAESGKMIIGQFHGETDDPMFKLQLTRIKEGEKDYEEGKEKFRVYPQRRVIAGGSEKKTPTLGGAIEVGQVFTYDFSVDENYVLTVEVNGETMTDQFDAASYKKKDPKWYRKWGCYSQEKAKGGKGTGRVRFYDVSMYESVAPQDDPIPEQTPNQLLAKELERLLAQYTTGDVDLKTAKTQLNDISTRIKSVADEDERYALNVRAQQVKGFLK